MASIFNTGIGALNAFQRQLATTGHNIANVNTPGYSRQVVNLAAREAQVAGGVGYIGSGVEINSIKRNYDQFLADRVRAYSATHEEYRIFYERATQVDSVIADAAAGIDEMMGEFFASVQDVSADPSSIPARNVMINRSELLADRFQSLSGWMDDLRRQGDRDLENYVTDINGIGQSLARINARLQEASSVVNSPPNDLLDQRDKLIDDLSQLVGVTTLTQSDGSINVFIGSGQALVVGGGANQIAVTDNTLTADHKEISIALAGGGFSEVTDQLSGGKLGGLLRFRSDVLDPAQNAIGLVGVGLAHNFNLEHVTGVDLDGDLGGNYFVEAQPQVAAHINNSGSISVAFDDVGQLNGHEYDLRYDGASWNIEDLTTGTVSVLGAAGPFVHEGLGISIGAGAAAGDIYRIRPTRSGASDIEALVGDPRDIAAAEAVSVSEGLSNTGTGHIDQSGQTSSTGTSLAGLPITLTFSSATNEFTYPPAGSVAYDPAADSGDTLTLTIPGLGDFSFRMQGTPANGDTFAFGANTSAVGDNRNAIRLANLQNQNLLFGGTANLSDAYGFTVAEIGTQTHQAGANADVQEQLLTQSESAKASVAGVNLDEEAADLVRFQQAYSAAAQVIATANSIFDTLIGAVRR